MGKIEDAKIIYDSIEIPKELRERVNTTIEKERFIHMKQTKKKNHKVPMGVCGAVAAVAVVLVVGLNTSSTFAAVAKEVPVLGKVAEVFTFRNYEYADADTSVYGEIPGVTIEAATVAEEAFTNEVNVKIQEQCEAYLADAIIRVKEYKEAFLETGGTEEEFAEKGIEIKVGYEILSQTEDTLSFVVEGTESWIAAYAMTEYYNLDLTNLNYLSLEDVLGADYQEIANTSIRAQMQQQMADGTAQYFAEEDGGFAGITEDVCFYLNEQGLPVVVFEKYEVAPGSEGQVEFVIDPSAEIAPMDTQAANTPTTDTQTTNTTDASASAYQIFAEEIRSAFLAKDMEAVADLMAYPAYVGIGDGVVVESKEDFLALAPEEIFTEEMLAQLEDATFENLEKYGSGITILESPSITFNETESGELGITGMNY